MPEYPDIVTYLVALEERVVGKMLQRIQVRSPFLVRTVMPEIEILHGLMVRSISKIGKRIVWHFDDELFLVFHLMIAGRFHMKKPGTLPKGKNDLAAFSFEGFTLMLTEASQKKRASLHVLKGRTALEQQDRGGIDPIESSFEDFLRVLKSENHTLKRFLTDPRLLSGIGNAYSDEILHSAKLSPVMLTSRLNDDQVAVLYISTITTLISWTCRLLTEAKIKFPEKVTAFHPEMAVHGRFRQPCPVCGTAVQRIVRTENESNYCPRCQTGGKLLADRSLSRLLKDDWPKTIEE